MIVDKTYCMSSFLMYRTVVDENRRFKESCIPKPFSMKSLREPVSSSAELEEKLRFHVENACKNGKAALALSGGIDSAILAKFMPKGSVAYTFKCVVPGIEVVDETPAAKRYAEECGLEHRIVEIYWEDFEKYSADLMKRKGSPIHSIEVQIYKASIAAKKDGFDTLIFGESADANFGGLNGLLSKDWTTPDFIDRMSNVLPYKALKDSVMITEPFSEYSKNGFADVHNYIRHVFFKESMGSYENATELSGIKLCAPYAETYMGVPLDYQRVRSGDSKYFVREIFHKYYPDFTPPPKTPMPRPMNEWLQNWQGPTRSEFWPHCTDNMTGDQKWLVYILEKFMDLFDL